MKKFVWMEITEDVYELPVAIADSSTELAKIVGKTKDNIESQFYKFLAGKQKRTRYIKVYLN